MTLDKPHSQHIRIENPGLSIAVYLRNFDHRRDAAVQGHSNPQGHTWRSHPRISQPRIRMECRPPFQTYRLRWSLKRSAIEETPLIIEECVEA
jgi:hypothetical protein